ncbi:glutathione S-transferase family protein [Flexibacterium corallicola]|uniref:glutathione S-transferase family protein n=1 Tax=Flexibacterium corallicola TaxID=3037259 RepID=UPI00286EC68C|nr:glutathione S-transferase family protein [Pseudovibrio sp. M1P-2-3]
MKSLRFYCGTYNASSWAMRAWLSLKAADLIFEEIMVDIKRPQRFANLDHMASLSPSATVPALVVDGLTIFDSLAIMEFANDTCEGRLLPVDLVKRAQARSLVAWQHAGLSSICARISFESAFYPYKRALTEGEQKDAERLCAAIEPILEKSGGPYLFGAASLADHSLTPAAIRLLRHTPDLSRWPLSKSWMETICADPLVDEWMRKADQLPHIWFDDYLITGEKPALERDELGAPLEYVLHT